MFARPCPRAGISRDNAAVGPCIPTLRGLNMRLEGKIAAITGGGSGIGRACALAFAA